MASTQRPNGMRVIVANNRHCVLCTLCGAAAAAAEQVECHGSAQTCRTINVYIEDKQKDRKRILAQGQFEEKFIRTTHKYMLKNGKPSSSLSSLKLFKDVFLVACCGHQCYV